MFVIVVMVQTAKNWAFTLNNYTDDDVERFRAIGTEGASTNYLCFGREVGESGTPHLQCYVSFKKRRSLSYARDLFSDRAHYEVAKGSPVQNREYCKKENSFEEFGKVPGGQGTRTELIAALEAVKGGASKRILIDDHPIAYSRSWRVLEQAMLIYAPGRNWMPEVYVFWGETRTGKTRKAYEECIAKAMPYMHPGGSWFDGYDAQEDAIFDDFGGSEFKLTYLLKLLDRYPMRVPVKGGFVNWVPRRIYITSNYPPKEWFPNAKEEHVKALLQRFLKVVQFRRLETGSVSQYKQDDEVVVTE